MFAALVAAAFITGAVINDFIQKNTAMETGKHAFFGFIAVVSLWALEASGRAAIAWGLLLVPSVVFFSSLIYVFVNGMPAPAVVPAPAPAPAPQPEPEPTVNLPDENTVCVELEFDPSKSKPAPLPSCDVSEETGEIGMPGSFPVKPSPTEADAAAAAQEQKPPTPEEILASLNKRLTPYTVCD